MRRLAAIGILLLVGQLAAQKAYLFKYPLYVQGSATQTTGTPFALLGGIRPAFPDTTYFYKPRLNVYTSYKQYFWVDSTSESTSYRNTWQNDYFMWVRHPVLRSVGSYDTLRVWTEAKCLAIVPGELDTIRFRVRLKGTSSNIDTPGIRTVTVLDMTPGTGNGGWLAGHVRASSSGPFLQNYAVLAFRGDTIIGSCISEDNRISEGYPSDSGFFHMAVKAGAVDSVSVYARTSWYAPSSHHTFIAPPWTVVPGDTTWVDAPPSGLTIENITATPAYPLRYEDIWIRAKVYSPGNTITDDSLWYARNDSSAWTKIAPDTIRSDSVRVYRIPGQPDSSDIYFHILAKDNLGARLVSPLQTVSIPMFRSVPQIQFTAADSSPYAGTVLQTDGVVTGVISQRKFFIGTAAGGPWGGVHCYQRFDTTAVPVHVGDSVAIIGRVVEYNRLTQMDTFRRIVNYGTGQSFDTMKTTLAGFRAAPEALEGVLLRLDTVRFVNPSGLFVSNSSHLLVDAAGVDTVTVFITSGCLLIGTPIPTGYFNLVANGYQYQVTRELLPRVLSDLIPIPIDVGAVAILAPAGTVQAGDTVFPIAVFRNHSAINTALDVPVGFTIGGAYYATGSIPTLAPGADDTLYFPYWAAVNGIFVMKAYTDLAGDPNPANDTVFEDLEIRAEIDVALLRVFEPTYPLVVFAQETVGAWIRNIGTSPALLFNVRLTRLNNELSSVPVLGLMPGESMEVRLPLVPDANARRYYQVYHDLAGDLDRGNDTLGLDDWIFPAGTYKAEGFDLSETWPPPGWDTVNADGGVRCWVREQESDVEHSGRFYAGVWYESESLRNDDWLITDAVTPVSGYADTLGFYVRAYDGGWHETLEVWVMSGPNVADTLARVYLGRVFWTNWPPQKLSLDAWDGQAIHIGFRYSRTDGNELILDDVWLMNRPLTPPDAWTELAGMPPGAKGKKVKDGARLTQFDRADTSFLYAFKGNNRCEFYSYDIAANAWLTRESIPAVGSLGKKKAVKKGSALTTVEVRRTNPRLAALKGGGTLEFWQYVPDTIGIYPWTQKPDVPPGSKKVKEGSGMVTVRMHHPHGEDTSYIYLLKGSNTTEFYRFNLMTDAWETMANAPLGASNRAYKNGSCLAYDQGNQLIYALKATYNELHVYRVDSNTWSSLSALPFEGSAGRKKVKYGAGLAYYDNCLYALKGGNTVEFWRYEIDSNRWLEFTGMPLGSSGKKVKGGGSLVYANAGIPACYALKGNNTFEFWRYSLAMDNALAGATPKQSALSSPQPAVGSPQLLVSPNPVRGPATVSYSLPKSGPASLKLYDVTGKLVATLAEGHHRPGNYSLRTTTCLLARGIYLLKLRTEGSTATAKLILE